jgi:hypothetical protein
MNETSPSIQSVVPAGGFLGSAKATDHLLIGSAPHKNFSNLPSERESSCEDANYSRSDDGFKQSSLRNTAVSVYLVRQRNEVEKIINVINQILSGCTPGSAELTYYHAMLPKLHKQLAEPQQNSMTGSPAYMSVPIPEEAVANPSAEADNTGRRSTSPELHEDNQWTCSQNPGAMLYDDGAIDLGYDIESDVSSTWSEEDPLESSQWEANRAARYSKILEKQHGDDEHSFSHPQGLK